MELTNTRRGFRHRSGSSSFDGISSTRPVQRGPEGVMFAKPKNGPGTMSRCHANRAAIRSA